MKSIYLDYAAATPLLPAATAAMGPFWQDQFYNPSALYDAAQQTRASLEANRASLARLLGAKPQEIIFTAGATESINLAIHGVMAAFPGSNLLVSAVEHEAVLATAEQYDHSSIAVTAGGLIDLDSLARAINDKTVLISVMYVNNETGTIQPLKAIGQLVHTVRQDRAWRGVKRPLYLHSDASQAAHLDLNVSRLGVDLLTLNGGKAYGPKQSGLLYARKGTRLEPFIRGGGQERGLRSGTEAVAQIAGLATALAAAQAERQARQIDFLRWRTSLLDRLTTAFPAAELHGHPKHQAPHILSLAFPGLDGEWAIMALDLAGIQAATGSACSAANDQPSHVVRAMTNSAAQAAATLRFSFGLGLTDQHIADASRRIISTLAGARPRAGLLVPVTDSFLAGTRYTRNT